ncbi:MAG: ATP-binding protein [Kiritimatiellae bacterium]|nr:ATP-binding protein [Kiritimatiellia bacterium]
MVGRDEEIEELRAIAAGDRSSLVVVYGRRRIGKTFLIREAFNYSFAFSHTGMEKGMLSEQLHQFRESLVDHGWADCPVPKTWIEAFSLLKKFLAGRGDGRKIVFIDELPWMDTPRSSFLCAFEHFWNGWCSARKDIVLIVCGSATSWMTQKVLRNKGGLFNRASRTINLQPFTLHDCEAYVREKGIVMSRREVVEAYMVFGGVPYYWSLLDRRFSFAQNLDRLYFSPSGELVPEFRRLFESVFRRPDLYLRLVTVLGKSSGGMTREELAHAANVSNAGKLTRWLNELEQSGFIKVFLPFGRRKKGALYQLVDAFALFHFRFMRIAQTVGNGFWSMAADLPERRAWEGLAFERVCFMHSREIKEALRIGGVITELCSWRSDRKKGGAQIDMLLARRDGVINVCEMKFSTGQFAITPDYAGKLANKVAIFKEETGTECAVHLTLVTMNGVKRNENASIVQSEVTADDLFRA